MLFIALVLFHSLCHLRMLSMSQNSGVSEFVICIHQRQVPEWLLETQLSGGKGGVGGAITGVSAFTMGDRDITEP